MGEDLEDGANPRTPEHDNLLLGFARTQSRAYGSYAASNGGAVELDDALGLSMHDTGAASGFGNTATLSRPVPSGREAELVTTLRSFYGQRAGGPFVLFSPWPLDLGEQGFHLVGHPPLMMRPAGPVPAPQSGLTVRRVTTVEDLDRFEQVMVDGFPVEELQPWQPRCLLGEDALDTPWQLFLGLAGEEAVATAAAYVDEVSIVEQVAVLPSARGHGYGFDITAAAAAAGPADRPSLLIASDLGRPVYDRLGYLSLLRYTLWLGLR